MLKNTVAVIALLLGSHCAAVAQAPAHLFQDVARVQPFSLTERSGKTITNADLKGKVWVAQFFFTTCKEGCGQTTQAMAELQKIFAGKRDVALVSVSLNPGEDTLEVLRDYANYHGADPEQWLFLTAPEDQIYKKVQETFFVTALPTPENKDNPIMHDFKLLVIDRDGMIRGYANGKNADEIEPLIQRVRELAAQRYMLPRVNAALNSLCAVLLLAGYVAIRRRQETLHITIMLAALVVSIVFLASYLFFHFAVLDGQPTRFRGEGWVRPVYFGILLTHTILAAIVAPLALYVVYLGAKDQRGRHRRIARWTLPIWLYVSVTGVVVYWLLYQVYPPY